jgi:hypothetical protein
MRGTRLVYGRGILKNQGQEGDDRGLDVLARRHILDEHGRLLGSRWVSEHLRIDGGGAVRLVIKHPLPPIADSVSTYMTNWFRFLWVFWT